MTTMMITLIVVLSNFYGLVFILGSNPQIWERAAILYGRDGPYTFEQTLVYLSLSLARVPNGTSGSILDQKNVKKLILRPAIYQIRGKKFLFHF